MAWGNQKTTLDDTNHPTPRKLPPNGWAQPEQRAAEAAIEAVNQRHKHPEEVDSLHVTAFHMQNDMDAAELRRMQALEREMDKPRTEQIKDIIAKLTYGEMIDISQAWADAMPTGTVDKDAFKLILPPTLHAWATSPLDVDEH